MQINIIYDSSVGSAPTGFQADISAAVNFLQAQFTDNITFNLHVGYGEVNGTTMGAGALGNSRYSLNSYAYSQIRTALVNDSTTADDATAVSTLPASDPVSGTHNWWVTQVEQVALGLTSGVFDAYVGFANTANATFDYDRSDGITAGQYDFIGTVMHEVTEVMGRQLGVGEDQINNDSVPDRYALDLFHYSLPGVRDLSARGGYYSIDNGATRLADFNTNPGGDSGDWGGSTANDSYLAFSGSGHYNDITPTDLQVMDVIGYNRVVDDYGADVNFAGQVAVNGSATGNLEHTGDRDWFRVHLDAGTSYRIDLSGSASGGGTLSDPYLRLYNSSSGLITLDDDSGPGLDSRLFYTPTTSGYYYVSAARYSDSATGTYTARVTTDEYAADFLTTGNISVGGSATGNLEVAGDHDWFSVQLAAGATYIFQLNGHDSNSGTLSDPYVRLYNGASQLVGQDDDSGTGANSQLSYAATSSGTYYIDAGAYSDFYAGTYTVRALKSSQTVDNSDGTHSITQWDVLDQGTWTDATTNYDSQWRGTSEVVNYDDGTHQLIYWDAANQGAWSDATINYDSQWRGTSEIVNYDDGGHQVIIWDAPNQFNWASDSSLYDAQWHLLSHTRVYDDGTIVSA